MNTMFKRTIMISTLTGMLLVIPISSVFAQTNTPKETRQATRLSTLKTKADDEISKRITSLNDLITRLNGLKRLSDSEKSDFSSKIQTQITNLTNLKTKIDADTDLTTLQTDRKSVYVDYRIYMVFIPQERILATADRIEDVIGQMNQLETKLQDRINTAKSQGKDVTALQNALNDMQTKVNDAKSQYTNAINTASNLTPDHGDQSKIASNKTAFQNARTMIKTAIQDLKTARTDIKTIQTGLK